MKNRILFIIISILAFSLAFTGCSQKQEPAKGSATEVSKQNDENKKGNSEDKLLENDTLVLGLDDSFPPMGFRDEEGKIVGFDIDLAEEVAKRMGVKLELKPIDWSTKSLTLNKGDIDVIWNGFSIDEQRKKEVDFSTPYLNNKQIVVVSNDSKIEDKDGLSGKILAVQSGSTSDTALSKDKKVSGSLKEVKKYSDNVQALMDLKIGRVDAVLVDEVVGRYYVAKKPGDYKILKEDFGTEQYAVGIKKGNTKLTEAINKALEEVRADGTEAEISKKWFGEDIVSK
ncbi:amino acid ABC transporter periplasmic solute-binding protein [Gottschalkia acidurici 9a]|uniref:Amino acid ABC transporter periplasmic solute-binding protein n=1 Tax=Gottschalkia acidurici (strain ATCC 7906 / DSM 604 / BCRC 14475 / CIP 104303 / KCTC 5404 / NCIMB 10678 / 9a) TaxID=1128398 RepID=K0AY75_GOTA9|nr:amino acid ABC transporter substrate-binding protein [Gottschalkia acidurici]AFS77710.1 amino acid ABC transporter periplasmic solute-binding protein [Gottschalkia acidurici 9a]